MKCEILGSERIRMSLSVKTFSLSYIAQESLSCVGVGGGVVVVEGSF
jgi:hypothetical protein